MTTLTVRITRPGARAAQWRAALPDPIAADDLERVYTRVVARLLDDPTASLDAVVIAALRLARAYDEAHDADKRRPE